MDPVNFYSKIEVCRICPSAQNLTNLYLPSQKTALETLKLIINIEDPELPKYICDECEIDLMNFIEFKIKCENRENELRENIRLFKMKNLDIKPELPLEHEIMKSEMKLEEYDVFDDGDDDDDESTNSKDELDTKNSQSNDELSETEAKDPQHDQSDIKKSKTIEFTCHICNEIFHKNSKLTEHKNTHKKCPDCNKEFRNYSLMMGHKRRVHKIQKTWKSKTCPICSKNFSLFHELFDHKKLEHKHCPDCLEEFDTYGLMIQHRESVHSIKTEIEEAKFPCNLCGKEVRDVYRHIRAVHNKKRKLRDKDSVETFPCPYPTCDKTFKIKDNINRHVRSIHLKERNFRCDVCDMSFFEVSQMKNHILTHNTERPLICDFPDCKKTFKYEISMRSHKNTHLSPEERILVVGKGGIFICSYCGKVMHSKAGHAMHLLIHTNEKPHECEICHKKFRHAMVLLAHKRIHTNEKPFLCTICNTSFRQHSHLITHKLTHETDKKFSCSICDMSTKFKYNLDTHMKTVHQVENNYMKN